MDQEPATGSTPELTGRAPDPVAPPVERAGASTATVPPVTPAVPVVPAAPGWAGWAQLEPDRAATAPDRSRDLIIPLVILLVTVGGPTVLRLMNATTGYAQGLAVGSAIGALAMAGLFYLVARRFGGPRGRRRARMVAAGLPLLLMILASFSQDSALQAPAADPQTAMVIGTPFTLVAAPDAVVRQVSGESGAGTWAVRQVNHGTESVGYVLATSGGGESDGQYWSEFDKGVTAAGASSAPTLIGDVPGRIVTGQGMVGLAWRLAGLSVQVMALDEASAREIAAAQMDAQSSPAP